MPDDAVGLFLKRYAYKSSMAQDLQVIPARHGTATFVPSGSTIKIVNTSGTQVVDTWAFALPTPPQKREKDDTKTKQQQQQQPDQKQSSGGVEKKNAAPAKDDKKEVESQAVEKPKATSKKGGKKSKKDMDLPSQEEAEQMTQQFHAQQEAEAQKTGGGGADGATPKKSTWSSYVPSLGLSRNKQSPDDAKKAETKENSRSWGQYFSVGQGFSSYVPNRDTISAFASSHYRDPNKSYAQQLADFSKTPVGAAGISMVSGSGYASSLYAGYSAWNAENAPAEPAMEFLSMPHTRAATTHLIPKVNDVLVSNLREPMLTLLEDTSPGIHDTLIAACDPQRYKGLGVEKWEEHGSCAENLVLALKELNEKAGLKGAKGIGADVTVNAVPAPLNLFMNIPWTDNGDVEFAAPAGKKGDFVRLRAERDVVVVMSACPQDVLEINGKDPQDGHFIVEEVEGEEGDEDVRAKLAAAEKQKKSKAGGGHKKPVRRAPPKKLNRTGSEASSVVTNGTAAAAAQKGTASSGGGTAPAAARRPSTKPATTTTTTTTTSGTPSTPAKSTPKPASNTPSSKSASAKSAPTNGDSTTAAKPEDNNKAAEENKAAGEGATEKPAAPPAERKKPKKLAKRGSVQQPQQQTGDAAKAEEKKD